MDDDSRLLMSSSDCDSSDDGDSHTKGKCPTDCHALSRLHCTQLCVCVFFGGSRLVSPCPVPPLTSYRRRSRRLLMMSFHARDSDTPSTVAVFCLVCVKLNALTISVWSWRQMTTGHGRGNYPRCLNPSRRKHRVFQHLYLAARRSPFYPLFL